MADLTGLILDSDDDLIQSESELIDQLRQQYNEVRRAIISLATGQAVASITISGKTTQFMQTDLPQLRTLRDELSTELRTLLGTGQPKCFRIRF